MQPGPLRLTGFAPLQRDLLAQGSLQGNLSPRELTAPQSSELSHGPGTAPAPGPLPVASGWLPPVSLSGAQSTALAGRGPGY